MEPDYEWSEILQTMERACQKPSGVAGVFLFFLPLMLIFWIIENIQRKRKAQ